MQIPSFNYSQIWWGCWRPIRTGWQQADRMHWLSRLMPDGPVWKNTCFISHSVSYFTSTFIMYLNMWCSVIVLLWLVSLPHLSHMAFHWQNQSEIHLHNLIWHSPDKGIQVSIYLSVNNLHAYSKPVMGPGAKAMSRLCENKPFFKMIIIRPNKRLYLWVIKILI